MVDKLNCWSSTYQPFTYAGFFSTTAFFAGFAGLDLPNDPLAILPFFVLMSPRPMLLYLEMKID